MRNNRKIIYIADDDEDDRELIADALEENGVPLDFIKHAHDGHDLLAKLQTESTRPSIILLDLNMPRMNGREVLSALKSDNHLSYVPVVMFTTSDLDIDIKDCYDLGCNSYMSKPNTYGDLVKAMGSTVDFWTNESTCVI